jgi:hypothetical protein
VDFRDAILSDLSHLLVHEYQSLRGALFPGTLVRVAGEAIPCGAYLREGSPPEVFVTDGPELARYGALSSAAKGSPVRVTQLFRTG